MVVSGFFVRGVFTRRVDDLLKTLGMEGAFVSQVSEVAKRRDTEVAALRAQPRTTLHTPVCGPPPWP